MNYLGNIIDRPDMLTAFAQDHGAGVAFCIIMAWGCSVIYTTVKS